MNRKEAPSFEQPENLKLNFPNRVELSNGIQLFWMKDVKDDSVKLDIEWSAGSKYQNSNMVASFANRLFLSGTDKLSAKEISEKIDFYGGFVSHDNDKDHGGLTIYGLKENISSIFEIITDAMKNCVFPESEFLKDKAISLNKFKIESEKVKTLCRREFNRAIYGRDSIYGQVASIEDFDKLKKNDLEKFYQEYYQNQAPALFLVGNVDENFIDDLRQWSKDFKISDNQLTEITLNQERGMHAIEKKDAIQTAIRIGRLFVNKKHPDYFHFQVLNTILGGYFGSRLMANIREDKGYTYGIGSGVAVLESAAYFFISTEVASEVKEETIKEIYFEIDRLKNESISKEELDKVKNYLLGEFLRNSDGPIAIMENFKNIYFNDLSESYYSDFIQAIHDLKPERLKELANQYLKREDMLEVVAG